MEFQCEYIYTEERHPAHEGAFTTIIDSMEEETELKGIKDTRQDCYLLGNMMLKGKPGQQDCHMDALFICKQFAIVVDFEDAQDYVTGKASKPGQTPAQCLDQQQRSLLQRINSWNSKKGITSKALSPWNYTAGIIAFRNCPKDTPLPEMGCKSEDSIILRSKDNKFAHAFWSLTCQANDAKGQKAFWDKPQQEWLFQTDEELKAFLKSEGIELKCWAEAGNTGKARRPVSTPKPSKTTPAASPRHTAGTPAPQNRLMRYGLISGGIIIGLLVSHLGPRTCQEKRAMEKQELAAQGTANNRNDSHAAESLAGTATTATQAQEKPDTTTRERYKIIYRTDIAESEVIAQKDKEIAFLRNRVADLEDETAGLDMNLGQKTTELENTNASLEETRNSLLKTQAQLASAWVAAGDNLLENVQKMGPMKGHGNMKAIKEVQLSMISQAIECYKNAIAAGNKAASSKQAKAQAMYNTYKGS